MTRELRANLIFFVCLILFATPGFLLLMHRKLNGSARPNDLPDPVPSAIAYIQPLPVPPLPRMEPKVVRDWVRRLLQDREGDSARMARNVSDGGDKAVVSDRFVTQLVSLVGRPNGSTDVALLIWDERSALATEQIKLVADWSGVPVEAAINRLEPIDVPREVRHALQDVGYVRPPEKVYWLAATLPDSGKGLPKSFTLRRRLTAAEPEPELILVPQPNTTTTRSTETAR